MFLAYVKQSGEGCDYTIGCGQALWKLEAKTRSEAIKQLKQEISNDDTGRLEQDESGKPFYNKITLFEVANEVKVPLDEWYTKDKQQARQKKIIQAENKERAEYERLSKKFT